MTTYFDAIDVVYDNSLHFTVQFSATEIVEFLARKLKYSHVSRIVESINSVMPVMNYGLLNGQENPNNGHFFHTFKFGREYSSVLYLEVVKAYLPAGYKFDELTAKLKKTARKFGADEFDVTFDVGIVEYRFWFDKR